MTGSIKKRSKNSWTIIIYLGRDSKTNKKRQKWYTVTGTKRDAEREKTRLLHELETGQYVEPSRMTVSEYLQKWLDHAKNKVNPKTHERYEQLISNNLVPQIGGIPLAKLQPLHIQDAYDRLLESGRTDGRGGLSSQTVLHCHRVLRTALHQAVRWQLVIRSAVDGVDPPTPAKREMQALDEIQTVWLFSAAQGTRLYVPILFTATTGVRRGELLALGWSELNLDGATATIRRSLEQTRKGGLRFKYPKNNKGRTITLPSLLIEALREHKSTQDGMKAMMGPNYNTEDLVFPRQDGTIWKPEQFTDSYFRFARKIGVKLRFHDLRHTHASQLLRAGVPVKVVSERLGHSAVGITLDTYSHVLPGMQEEAAQKIDAALRAAMETPRLV